MQSTKILISILIITGMFLTSCEKLLEPANDNHSTTDRLTWDPGFGENLMINGYANWLSSYALDEVATDDAVINVKGNNYQRMSTGEWSAIFNPISVWNSAYTQIYYLNYFLSIIQDIQFAWDNSSSPAALRDSLFEATFYR